jgi:hypothetical protein
MMLTVAAIGQARCAAAETSLAYTKLAEGQNPIVFTYYQPAAAPSVQPQPACCAPCAPQVVPAVPAPPLHVNYRPVLPLAPMPETYYAGQGILGQPKLYVPGQPIRNLLRYLGP